MIPVNSSLHCDAWRDINLSYENVTEDDPWGWIHENEEMRCGCEPERALYARHNVSFGVEGPNGMSSDVRGLGEPPRLHTDHCPHQLVARAKVAAHLHTARCPRQQNCVACKWAFLPGCMPAPTPTP